MAHLFQDAKTAAAHQIYIHNDDLAEAKTLLDAYTPHANYLGRTKQSPTEILEGFAEIGSNNVQLVELQAGGPNAPIAILWD